MTHIRPTLIQFGKVPSMGFLKILLENGLFPQNRPLEHRRFVGVVTLRWEQGSFHCAPFANSALVVTWHEQTRRAENGHLDMSPCRPASEQALQSLQL